MILSQLVISNLIEIEKSKRSGLFHLLFAVFATLLNSQVHIKCKYRFLLLMKVIIVAYLIILHLVQ